MTNIPETRFVSAAEAWPSGTRNIFLVVGLACIVGFVANWLTYVLPPNLMALEWRIGFMQQVSGRSILLFSGVSMVVYASLGQQRLARYLALVCLLGGILFLLSGVIVIRDRLALQNQTLGNIESQATELRSQLETAKTAPNLPADVTPERIEEVLAQLDAQAESLSQDARNSTTKSMMSVLGTQVVVGLGLLSLGRFGIQHSSRI